MYDHAIIFANGAPASFTWSNWQASYTPTTLLIGADGGAAYFERFGVLPHRVLGDFDSLSAAHLQMLEEAGVQIERHSRHKDQTDLELAVDAAQAAGIDRITIFGALGSRWDMALANMLLLARPAYANLHLRLLDAFQELQLIQPGAAVELAIAAGATLSLIPLQGDATGVTTTGLRYPLQGGTLPFGATLGLSNIVAEPPVTVYVETGLLLAVLFRQPPP